MKLCKCLLLIVALLVSLCGPAQAGFIIKKHMTHELIHIPTTAESGSVISTNSIGVNHSVYYNVIRKLTYPLMRYRQRPTEWVGIAALFTGILGLFIPGLNFLAILFGVLGMGRNCKTNGLAIAGFVLGVLELLLFLVFGSLFLSLILF